MFVQANLKKLLDIPFNLRMSTSDLYGIMVTAYRKENRWHDNIFRKKRNDDRTRLKAVDLTGAQSYTFL